MFASRGLRPILAFLGILGCLTVTPPRATADLMISSFDTSSVPTVTIHSSGDSGTFYAGAFQVIDQTTDPTGSNPFMAFCVDLHSTVGAGPTKFDATIYASISGITQDSTPGFPDSAYGDVGNRLAYLGSLFVQDGSHWDKTEIGGFQVALWNVIDSTLILSGASNSTLITDYSTFMSLVNGTSLGGIDGYVATTNYSTTFSSPSQIIWIDHQHDYQNLLAFMPTGGISVQAVPEPSTIALAISGLGLLGLNRLRRRRSR